MVRVLSLVAALMLAACATLPPSPPPQVAGLGAVVLGYANMADVPNRVQDDLFTTFGDEAFLRGIPFDDGVGGGSVVVRGYMSVVGNSAGTLLVYVFDFEDRAGNRLARVGGQVPSSATPADPWDVVDYDVVRVLVGEAMDAFEAWLDDNRVGA